VDSVQLGKVLEEAVMAWYERCEIREIRLEVGKKIMAGPAKDRALGKVQPGDFWRRMEWDGRLVQVLALYDEIAQKRAAVKPVRRETKGMFAERIEREGRQTEVEKARSELLASGLSNREVQRELVNRFQPLEHMETRAWETPDPWAQGRLFHKNADFNRLLSEARPRLEDPSANKAYWRIRYAEIRREERSALANARRRARKLITQAPVSVVKEPVSIVKDESGAYEVWVSPKPTLKEESGPPVAARQ
jgi:hypothetical protein